MHSDIGARSASGQDAFIIIILHNKHRSVFDGRVVFARNLILHKYIFVRIKFFFFFS